MCSPEGKVFNTFKDAAEYVHTTCGVTVKNRGILKIEQAREKRTIPPGKEVASYQAAPTRILYDCRICDSRFSTEADLAQHKRVHELSYTELLELSHLQKLEAQRGAPAGTGLLPLTGLASVAGLSSFAGLGSVPGLPSVPGLSSMTGLPYAVGQPNLEGKSALVPTLPSHSNAGTQRKVEFICSTCSGTFSCKKNLKRHMQRRHPEILAMELASSGAPSGRLDVKKVEPPSQNPS